MDAPDLVDEAALQRLHRIGGNELVNELVAIFLKTTPERITAALAGIKTSNMSQVLLSAHSLKSSCANLGIKHMRQLATSIEKCALEGNATPLPDLVQQLDNAFQLSRLVLIQKTTNPPQRPRIAVIEDNADNRLLVRILLEPMYDVTEYATGTEALADIRIHCPQLILLDISLPDIDGFVIIKAIRSDKRLSKVPVIALTAHAMTGDRDKILAAGFSDYVAKPIDDESILLNSIARLLNT